MTSHITAALSVMFLFGCAAVPAPSVEVNPPPTDVRIVSAPDSKDGSELGVVIATWALVVATYLGFRYAANRQSEDMRKSIAAAEIAADAAKRSADLAAEAVQQAAKDRRGALTRDATLALHRVSYSGLSVRKLADKVPTTMKELLGLAGRRVGDDAPLTDETRTRTVELEAMVKTSGKTLLTPWDDLSDAELGQILLVAESHLQKIQLIEAEVLRDLAQIDTEKAVVRSTGLAAGGRQPPDFNL